MMAANLQTIHQSHEAWSSHDTGGGAESCVFLSCVQLRGVAASSSVVMIQFQLEDEANIAPGNGWLVPTIRLPFGFRPIFRGYCMLVLGSVEMMEKSSDSCRCHGVVPSITER